MITGQSLIDRDSGRVLIARLRIADTFVDRFRGLLGAQPLADDEGLWLEPCNSIHMFGMAFALDVVFVDRQDTILRLVRTIRPWRATTIIWGAKAAIELAPGSIDRLNLVLGLPLGRAKAT